MKQELDVLEKVQHPSLVQVHDSNLDERWFVMRYFEHTLADHLEGTKGNLLASLVRFRPLVEAVATLHANGVVHRDIKPENVFVANDGRLVLGDCGLAIDADDAKRRITDTYENVGSRDWMPGWAYGMRLDAVKPSFDAFSLGKLLWAMVSGKRRLRLWYLHDPEFELETLFPDDPSMRWARVILDQCVVEREADCLEDAEAVLSEVNTVIEALRFGSQVLGRDGYVCRVCGLGTCTKKLQSTQDSETFVCDHCGNMQSFYKRAETSAWRESASASNESTPLIAESAAQGSRDVDLPARSEDALRSQNDPLRFLEWVEQAPVNGLTVVFENRNDEELELSVILQNLQQWNVHTGKFARPRFVPIALAKKLTIQPLKRGSAGWLAFLRHAKKQELSVADSNVDRKPPVVLREAGYWRATVRVALQDGSMREYVKCFDWTPGDKPRFVQCRSEQDGAAL